MKILLIEDNEAVAKTALMLMKVLKYETAHAATGAEAVQLMESFQPEVVLVDIGLPDMTGFEVAQQIRAKFGPTAILIAQTGYDFDLQRCLDAGFNDYYKKPFEYLNLPTIIKKLQPAEEFSQVAV